MTYTDFFSVKDKVIIFTGGSGHIVGELINACLHLGAKCISVDLRPEKLIAQQEFQRQQGFELDIYPLDVTSENDWVDFTKKILNQYGSIDGLINGAGINKPSTFLDIEVENFKQIFEVNLIGTLIGCQQVGRIMLNQKSGSIINISSTSADPPLSRAFAYSASKAAITNLTKNIAREFGQTGVRVNSLRPGFFPTEWNKKNFLSPERTSSILNHTPMARFGEPKELAGAVVWLLSEASSFVTGSEIVIDGGFSAQTI
jgi:NAD(P)-dependent dehydrogenase (short-subunit alcohol dehydrogenase family)